MGQNTRVRYKVFLVWTKFTSLRQNWPVFLLPVGFIEDFRSDGAESQKSEYDVVAGAAVKWVDVAGCILFSVQLCHDRAMSISSPAVVHRSTV